MTTAILSIIGLRNLSFYQLLKLVFLLCIPQGVKEIEKYLKCEDGMRKSKNRMHPIWQTDF
jgi:hypothetical protein